METPEFYEGVIEYQGEPDFEGLAQAINFLRAGGVAINVGRAATKDDVTRLAFLVKEPETVSLMGDKDAKRSVTMLKQVLGDCNVSYRKATPTAKKAALLKACTRLVSMKPDEELASAEDFVYRARKDAGSADPFGGLVGMQAQKQTVREIGDAIAKHGRDVVSSCHLAFIGNPGTGKTELARCLLAYFDQKGVTDGSGTFVKADAVNLIGRYVGETPRLVRDAVLRAEGGILFIDEAYRLADPAGGNAFGREAVNTLVEMMESRREKFICVMAGYPREMDELMAMNSGLCDRIGFRVAFPDYTLAELEAIFSAFAAAKGFAVADDAAAEVRDACRDLAKLPDFANARSVRRLFERCVIKASRRAGREKVIHAEDVRAAMADADVSGADVARHAIGFAG